MDTNEVFFDVYNDIRVPLISIDVLKLTDGLKQLDIRKPWSYVAFRIDVPDSKHGAFLDAIRGLIQKIVISKELASLFATDPLLANTAPPKIIVAGLVPQSRIQHLRIMGNQLIWEENSLRPLAYSTLINQFLNIVTLHKLLIEQKRQATTQELEALGFSGDNVETVSEYPRQLQTHLHFAAASLGAWLGGAINVQYFAYYAAIRQITHAPLNDAYAASIGYDSDMASALTKSGIIAAPPSLVLPLIEAQGSAKVFGSIGIDETNTANPPDDSFDASKETDHPGFLPGFLTDKHYRAMFIARRSGQYGFYGAKDVFRDHYKQFYSDLQDYPRVRCKHYCVPIVDVSSVQELQDHASRIPLHNPDGVFFRGQRQMYLLQREERVQDMLFGGSTRAEPSLVTSASRDANYDYDKFHFQLRRYLERRINTDGKKGSESLRHFQELLVDPTCRLDRAIMALAQHYGLPTHGLDVTTSIDIAVWFALNVFERDSVTGIASYKSMKIDDWPMNKPKWPVVFACQCVTESVGQSLQDCAELEEFGITAARPHLQEARFFQGGHSDHQNRLAETVVCVYRLKPGIYETEATFESLFPSPDEDPAYKLMLEFATHGAPELRKLVNRFHP
ncbi:FRG domain-containing protein [Sideroxydans lithotrophicus]|uniref:FRG domain protein n=1 Tax=Sideroxydans lithotrophicus (strain ES-1) TaxID=580332 RepID=D5CQV6_SIDLE|nr:FRG domain-containing protein [Sideroxydans lithotrophicus]ADE11342.1 FRG domain protein [Sideroxydans lithotrophicus ES-1]